MKALFWQWMLITTLCLAAQCIAAPFDNSKYLQEKYFSPKRTKPSLSIVNPLDVLRQRVMIEMARRQRENVNKQAEINKEILKSIGKRGNSIDYDIEEYLRNRYYDTARLYAPLSYHPNEIRPETYHDKQTNAVNPNALSTKLNMKNAKGNKSPNDATMNETNQEQVYVINDMINDINNDEDDSQIKHIYSLFTNRLSNHY